MMAAANLRNGILRHRGKIHSEIEEEPSPENGSVEVTVESNEKMVRVTVTDHGPGIPAAFHDRIFQKFAQADSSDTRQKGGTGLGLAITRELVERMGGRIGFESVENEGASFFFELPL